ncbi:MAG: hypothetical protein AAFZ49_16315, partial [Cyanobacteria bacterium J06659_2]
TGVSNGAVAADGTDPALAFEAEMIGLVKRAMVGLVAQPTKIGDGELATETRSPPLHRSNPTLARELALENHQ